MSGGLKLKGGSGHPLQVAPIHFTVTRKRKLRGLKLKGAKPFGFEVLFVYESLRSRKCVR